MKKIQTLMGMYEVTDRELEYLEWKELLRDMPQGPAIFDGSAAALIHIVKGIPDTWEPPAPNPDPPVPIPDPPAPLAPPTKDATIQDVVNVLELVLTKLQCINSKLSFLDKLNS